MIRATKNQICDTDMCVPQNSPLWMKRVLLAAGIYNIVWGTFAVLFPRAIFEWARFEPTPYYPQLWQSIGMIVGVYGIGYAIAAFDPVRHWPIVLVGLLGKIFGPIGFLQATCAGDFPVKMGWTILTNDLIWWVPFSVILWHAARENQSHPQGSVSVHDDPMRRIKSQRGTSIVELSEQQPTLIVLLRHAGCTFCRETLADLAAARDEIESRGTELAVVHMGATDIVELLRKHRLDDLHRFHDSTGQLYDAFELGLASFRQIFGLRVWQRGIAAFFRGHGMGRLEGNGFRMPGVFLVVDGQIVKSFRHATAADRPNYIAVATYPSNPSRTPPLIFSNKR